MIFSAEKAAFVEQAQKVFFMAMNQGYAAGVKASRLDIMHGSRFAEFDHEEGGHQWKVMDLWFVTADSPFSSGITIMSRDTKPVWQMRYGGWYEEFAIPVLKQVLFETYKCSRFIGGRGYRLHRAVGLEVQLVYVNIL